MKTSQLTRRMMIPALILGLSGVAFGQNQTQHYGGHHNRLHVNASASEIRGVVYVRTSVQDNHRSLRLPTLQLSRRRPTAFTEYCHGHYEYKVWAKLYRSQVFVTVKKFRHHHQVAFGHATAYVRRVPQRQTRYVVSTYHPLTRKRLSSQTFTDRAAALRWYNARKGQWWLFVYSGFSKTPKEYRGSRATCERSAANINRNILNGKRAKAMAPVVQFRTIR